MPDADMIIAYGEGYDRGTDVVHQELRSWRPRQHGPECVCDYCEPVMSSVTSLLRGNRDHQRGCGSPPARGARGTGVDQWSCRPPRL